MLFAQSIEGALEARLGFTPGRVFARAGERSVDRRSVRAIEGSLFVVLAAPLSTVEAPLLAQLVVGQGEEPRSEGAWPPVFELGQTAEGFAADGLNQIGLGFPSAETRIQAQADESAYAGQVLTQKFFPCFRIPGPSRFDELLNRVVQI